MKKYHPENEEIIQITITVIDLLEIKSVLQQLAGRYRAENPNSDYPAHLLRIEAKLDRQYRAK